MARLNEGLRARLRGRTRREFWLMVVLPTIAVVTVAFAITWRFVDPAPPRRLVMSTGAPGGGYDAIGQAYRVLLGREGIELELRPSSGSVENLQRLLQAGGDVDLALVQGGSISDEPARQSLFTLGSMTVEGVWILHRRGRVPITRLNQFAGARIAVGPTGSGNRRLAMSLFAAAGMDEKQLQLLPITGADVATAWREHKIDDAIVVAGAESPALAELLALDDLEIVALDQTDAFVRHLSSLHTVRLPRGVIDIGRDLPNADLTLLATTANLVVRDSIHPAIVDLLMNIATQVHGSRSLLAASGEFPAPRDAELPLDPQADQYYKTGRPFLQKYLPFWVATWVNRMAILLVPLLAVVLPIVRLMPAAMQWRIKRRIFRYYGDLSRLESRLDEHLTREQLDQAQSELDALERRIAALPVHWYYGDLVYGLRSHLSVVRSALVSRSAV